jgi:hypothetical protein
MTAPQLLPETLDVVALRAVPDAAEAPGRGTEVAEVPGRGTGERSRRRRVRRRLAREQLMVALFLLLALIATVAILGREWLDSAGPVTTSPDAISTFSTRATNLNGGGR